MFKCALLFYPLYYEIYVKFTAPLFNIQYSSVFSTIALTESIPTPSPGCFDDMNLLFSFTTAFPIILFFMCVIICPLS